MAEERAGEANAAVDLGLSREGDGLAGIAGSRIGVDKGGAKNLQGRQKGKARRGETNLAPQVARVAEANNGAVDLGLDGHGIGEGREVSNLARAI